MLASALRMAARMEGRPVIIQERSLDRQCVKDFVIEIEKVASQYDAILSLACGAGVQAVGVARGGSRTVAVRSMPTSRVPPHAARSERTSTIHGRHRIEGMSRAVFMILPPFRVKVRTSPPLWT